MTTEKTPRHGTLAYYRARTAELANQLASFKAGIEDANRDALRWHAAAVERERDHERLTLAANVAHRRAQDTERDRDAESNRADRLSADLARITARHGQQTTALCKAREDLAEETRTVEILTAELDRAKAAYASARIRCDDLAGQVMALQVRLGETQVQAASLVDHLTLARRNFKAAAVVAVVVAITLAAVVIYV
jgi:chromosome segregation ATPase